jgi:hypothetical protein
MGTLCQDLEDMLPGFAHGCEYILYKIKRHLVVEQVAHRVDKHDARLSPLKWRLQHVAMQRQPEAVPVAAISHGLEAFGQTFSIAICAA